MPIMESDSESQDSDDGRRFRFEATRKDAVPAQRTKRRNSPRRSKSRSRDRSRRDKSSDRSRHVKEDKSRSSNDRDSNSRHSSRASDNGRESKSFKDLYSRSSRHDRDSRSRRERTRDSRRDNDRKDSRDRSLKTRDRAKRSRERSRERSENKKSVTDRSTDKPKEDIVDSDKRNSDKERKDVNASDIEVNETKKAAKKRHQEDSCKVNQRIEDRLSGSNSNNPSAVSDSSLAVQNDDDSNYKRCKRVSDLVETEVESSENSSERTDSYYGPALPPSMTKPQVIKGLDNEPKDSSTERVIGPVLPPNQTVKSEPEEENFGPALPPHLRKMIGPVIPENLVSCSNEEDSIQDSMCIDDDNFGPLPSDHPNAKDSLVQMQLERRAIRIQEELLNKSDQPEEKKREEWMVELPPVHAVALGLGPRTFKTKEGPDMSDRSSWTDTPADKIRKQREKEEGKFTPATEEKRTQPPMEGNFMNDPKTTEIIKPTEAEDLRGESLLDMHLKTIKRKKKKLEKEAKRLGLSTRRPFDRDVDLQTNHLNEARKKKIFEKAQFLNDRFAPGKI